jgi:hypothetical protein
MKATQSLDDMGQSLWLDNITRGLLTSGTLRRYIQEFSVTGLTSNPTIFDHAVKNSADYDYANSRTKGLVPSSRAETGDGIRAQHDANPEPSFSMPLHSITHLWIRNTLLGSGLECRAVVKIARLRYPQHRVTPRSRSSWS